MKKIKEHGFMWWWHNIFMYHYAKYTLLALIAVVIVVFLTVDAITNRVEYDLGVVVAAGYGGIGETELEPLKTLAEQVVGDINGDGEVKIDLYIINMGEGMNEYNRLELVISKAEPDYLLIITDDQRSSSRGKRGDFDRVAKFELIPSSEDEWYRVYVGNSPAVQALPKAPVPDAVYQFTDVEYACLMTWKAEGALAGKRKDAAIRLVKALQDYENAENYFAAE